MSNTTINLSALSENDLKALMSSLPQDSELGKKIKEVLAKSQTAEALRYAKDALITNGGSIAKQADEVGGNVVTVATKLVETYGDVPFKFVNSVLGSFDKQLDAKLLKKRIKDELARRATI